METEILIIGAGAAGLMAGKILSEAGQKVVIVEARDRIGGRIAPIESDVLGYALEGGAEFVHGGGSVTKALLAEVGLRVVPVQGDYWSVRSGEPKKNDFLEVEEGAFMDKLKTVEEDMPIGTFIDRYFSDEQYAALRNDVTKMVEGYDAADMDRMSTIAIREEWANESDWQQGRVVEGYGAMIHFLAQTCRDHGAEIVLNTTVTTIDTSSEMVIVTTKDGERYEAKKVIITVPLPLLKTITFTPAIPEKMAAVESLGYGPAIKLFLKFKTAFWKTLADGMYTDMQMIISNEVLGTWWTQYPDDTPILTGWFAGPQVWQYKNASDDELVDTALTCLATIFSIDKQFLENELSASKIMNWAADPLTQGAYSYMTVDSRNALATLVTPIDNKVFFAGEALYTGKDIATVEGALASGKEVAEKLLTM